MIGYRTGINNHINVIITLEIPEDAMTDMDRPGIVNKEMAQYRTNKATVLKIEDKNGNTYNSCSSTINGGFDTYEYTVGSNLVIDDYDTVYEEHIPVLKGIYFSLNRDKYLQYNNVRTSYHTNGQKFVEYNVINGKYHGLCQMWYQNGQKALEHSYVNGELDGLYQKWNEDGEKEFEDIYENGIRVSSTIY